MSVFVTHKQWDSQISRIFNANIKNFGRSLSRASMRGGDIILEIHDDRKGMMVKDTWREDLKKLYLERSENADGIYQGDDAFAIASRKARYGHKLWIAWRNKDSERFCARMTRDTLKAALLAIGTQGQFNFYGGCPHALVTDWQLGVKWFRFPQFFIDPYR